MVSSKDMEQKGTIFETTLDSLHPFFEPWLKTRISWESAANMTTACRQTL